MRNRRSSAPTLHTTSSAGHQADEHRRRRRDEGAGGGDGHQAAQQPVAGHADVGLAQRVPDEDQRGDRPRAEESMVLTAISAMRGSGGQRRAGVEAEPAEGQDERAQHRSWAGCGPAWRRWCRRARNLPRRGPSTMAPGQGGHAAGHVHHRRAGEVDVPVAEARSSRPARASQPPPHTQFAVERVEQRRHEEPVDEERPRTSSARPWRRWGWWRRCP